MEGKKEMSTALSLRGGLTKRPDKNRSEMQEQIKYICDGILRSEGHEGKKLKKRNLGTLPNQPPTGQRVPNAGKLLSSCGMSCLQDTVGGAEEEV